MFLNKHKKWIQLSMFILLCGTFCILVQQISMLKTQALFLTTFHASSQSDYKETQKSMSNLDDHDELNEINIDLFKRIASKHDCDKVGTHHYQYIYGKILGPIRQKKLNFLEIGLGCYTGNIPGKSLFV